MTRTLRVRAARGLVCRGATLLLGLSLGIGRAHAQSVDEARAAFERGTAALAAGDTLSAIDAFSSSAALLPRAATLCNLGLAHERTSGHECAAAAAYRECAAMDTTGRYRARAQERATALAQARRCGASQDGPATAPPTPREPLETQPPAEATDGYAWAPLPEDAAARAAPPSPVMRLEPGRSDGASARRDDSSVPATRSHALLYIGGAAAIGAAAALTIGVVTALDARGTVAELRDRYPDGTIPAGTPDADAYETARAQANRSVILYFIGAGLAAAATTLISVDLAMGSGGTDRPPASLAVGVGSASLTVRY